MSETKKLSFKQNLLWDMIAMETWETWRKYSPGRHDLKQGELVMCIDECGVSVLLEVARDTEIRDWEITEDEAKKRGYESAAQMKYIFYRDFYSGSLDFEKDKLAIIRLKSPLIQGHPTISLNEHFEAQKNSSV